MLHCQHCALHGSGARGFITGFLNIGFIGLNIIASGNWVTELIFTSQFVKLNIGHKVTELIFNIEYQEFTVVIFIVVASGLVFTF